MTILGPNHCWHADGYDKLKPYGIPIYGAIDGFSRKIIWLKVVRTNNNPLVPAYHYLTTVSRIKKCPSILRTDCGTETGIMAAIHSFFHQDENAHKYGKSTTNQRIENWWSHSKKGYMSWVINFFKDLVGSGKFILGNYLHMECAWFVSFRFHTGRTEQFRTSLEFSLHSKIPC